MDEAEKDELKRRLLKYPDVTDENVGLQIEGYEERQGEKKYLVEERGFSNAMAESYLDRKGYSRPPGWHSVFFYPNSSCPRNTVVLWLPVSIGVLWFIFS